jgi:hypothetical protein
MFEQVRNFGRGIARNLVNLDSQSIGKAALLVPGEVARDGTHIPAATCCWSTFSRRDCFPTKSWWRSALPKGSARIAASVYRRIALCVHPVVLSNIGPVRSVTVRLSCLASTVGSVAVLSRRLKRVSSGQHPMSDCVLPRFRLPGAIVN